MPDREKVLKALEHHKETSVCNGCPYAGDDDTAEGNCPIYDDAIALLREKEPAKPEHNVPDPNVYYRILHELSKIRGED